jgi:hypothetical protein
MVTIATEIISLGFVIGTFAVFVAMAYYAVKILRGFKGGLLQEGWRMMALSAFLFIFGQLFLLGGAGQALAKINIAQYNITIGSALETLGGLLLVLGFRAQYKIWNPKKMIEQRERAIAAQSK